jgi:LPS sulfotransferase NodH
MKLTIGSDERARAFVERVRTHLPNVRIILLVRRDLVAQFGSLVKSQKTGVGGRHVGESKGRRTAPALELDRYEFAEYAIEAYQTRRRLRSMQETHEIPEISYEKVLLRGELPTYDPLFNFVGVEPQRAD